MPSYLFPEADVCSVQAPHWTTGQKVCILGHGTASGVHEHHVVDHLTRLYVVSKKAGATHTRRHRLRDERSAGSAYGWTTISATCQRPKKDER